MLVLTTSRTGLPVRDRRVERVGHRDHEPFAVGGLLAKDRKCFFGLRVIDRDIVDERRVDFVGFEVFDERHTDLDAEGAHQLVRKNHVLLHQNLAQQAALVPLDLERFLQLLLGQRSMLDENVADPRFGKRFLHIARVLHNSLSLTGSDCRQ
jgi:hypothetical protein